MCTPRDFQGPKSLSVLKVEKSNMVLAYNHVQNYDKLEKMEMSTDYPLSPTYNAVTSH